MIRDFRDLIVWQKAVDLAVSIYRLTRGFPADERFGITQQLREAAVSVSSNIAEGNGRGTTKDYLRFLSVSNGSLNEVRSVLAVSQRLDYAKPAEVEAVDMLLAEIAKMLTALRARLRSRAK